MALPRVNCNEQALGIYQVSVTWHDKIKTRPGGTDRRLFLDWLSAKLRQKLIDDVDMSYPGHNGFSVAVSDLSSDVERFLRYACDYGDLFDYPHTTREKSRASRRKWYLMPILSPYYQLPLTHTKEPWYIDNVTLKGWLATSGVFEFGENLKSDHMANFANDGSQMALFRTEG
jgi:hypothetical protein